MAPFVIRSERRVLVVDPAQFLDRGWMGVNTQIDVVGLSTNDQRSRSLWQLCPSATHLAACCVAGIQDSQQPVCKRLFPACLKSTRHCLDHFHALQHVAHDGEAAASDVTRPSTDVTPVVHLDLTIGCDDPNLAICVVLMIGTREAMTRIGLATALFVIVGLEIPWT